MVKHVIIWKLKDTLTEAEKAEVKSRAKEHLEALVGVIDGLVDMNIQIECLPSSNADMMLQSSFVSGEALAAYATHPAHVKVAADDVRPYVAQRSCIDFEI